MVGLFFIKKRDTDTEPQHQLPVPLSRMTRYGSHRLLCKA